MTASRRRRARSPWCDDALADMCSSRLVVLIARRCPMGSRGCAMHASKSSSKEAVALGKLAAPGLEELVARQPCQRRQAGLLERPGHDRTRASARRVLSPQGCLCARQRW